jgi:hypothetical protein
MIPLPLKFQLFTAAFDLFEDLPIPQHLVLDDRIIDDIVNASPAQREQPLKLPLRNNLFRRRGPIEKVPVPANAKTIYLAHRPGL